jgi:cell division protein FtsB
MQTAAKRANEYAQGGPSGKQAVKMQGNVAYISSDIVRYNRPAADVRTTPETPAKTAARPAVAKTVKPAAKTTVKPSAKAAAQPRTGFVSTLIVLFVAFGVLAVLVSRYAMVCSIGAKNNTIKNEITAVQAKMDALQLQIELDDNLQHVQEAAENELGMTYPTPEQKIQIDTGADGE